MKKFNDSTIMIEKRMPTLHIRSCFGMFTYPKWNLFRFWRQQQVTRSFIVYLDVTTTHSNWQSHTRFIC